MVCRKMNQTEIDVPLLKGSQIGVPLLKGSQIGVPLLKGSQSEEASWPNSNNRICAKIVICMLLSVVLLLFSIYFQNTHVPYVCGF